MSQRVAVILGLFVGFALVAIALVAIVLMAPQRASGQLKATASTPTSSAVASVGPLPPSPSSSASSTDVPATPGSQPASSSTATTPPGSGGTPAFHVGQLAPALDLPKVGGGSVDLAQLRGKGVWVYFMATWCPSCQEEIPLMNDFATRYGRSGLVVLAVDVREAPATVRSFASALSLAFPVALDADGAAAQRWSVLALPVHFWIDREGVVRDGALGGIGADVMAAGIRSVLPGVAVTP